jgi:hypothetical protein
LLAASIAFDYRHKEKDSVVAAKRDLQRGIATMDATKNELEQTKKDSLFFPTDAAALLFGLLIFSVAIFAVRRAFLSDPDTYWHIATAKWMLAERALPRHEIFSHTAAGQPWVNIEWLAQIILFSIYDWFGWRGLVLLCGLVIALTFVLLYALLARELRPTVALGSAALSFTFASGHFLARPHLLTFPIIVVWTAFLARASDENRRPSLWLLPLMVLWANLHGGFTLGLLLAAGFGLEATIAAPSAERRRVAIEWLSFLVGALLAACVTPYGYQSLLLTLELFSLGDLLHYIGDARPMNPAIDFKQELILLGLMAMALLFGVKIGLIRVLMIFGLLHLALQYVRGLTIFALVLPLMIAHPLRQQFAFLRPSTDPFPLFDIRRLQPLMTIVAVMVVLVVAGLFGAAYVILRPVDAPPDYDAPAAALDYAAKANVSGPVLNHFDFGGYLIFRGIPTFMDGRVLPFGKPFFSAYTDATKPGAGDKLERLADAYNASWTLLKPRSEEALHFDHSPGWRRLYADDVAVIHVRR